VTVSNKETRIEVRKDIVVHGVWWCVLWCRSKEKNWSWWRSYWTELTKECWKLLSGWHHMTSPSYGRCYATITMVFASSSGFYIATVECKAEQRGDVAAITVLIRCCETESPCGWL